MEVVKPHCRSILALALIVWVISMTRVSGQISTPCSASMISSFTPCLNFLTGSSSNGSSPTAGCCSSLASLIAGGTDCACLILTGNVPLQLPINRTLGISLPRACNMGSVPLRCKASASPLPAPGPFAFSPGLPPRAPTVPESDPPAPSPASATAVQPPLADSANPTASPVLRPVTPNVAVKLSNKFATSLLLSVVGLLMLE